MRYFFMALLLFAGAFAPAAAAETACGGVDLIARMKKEEPESYARLAAEAKQIPFGDARYFRIRKGDGPASHIFGTMHVSDPRALAWVKQIEPVVLRSRRVATENHEMDAEKPGLPLFKFFAMMVAKPDELLSNYLKPDEIERVANAAAPLLSLSPAAVTRLRPWILFLMLSLSPCDMRRTISEDFVDRIIERRAVAEGLPLHNLESVDDMIAALTAPAMETQIDLLRSALNTLDMVEDMQETSLRMLDRGETGLLFALARDTSLPTLKYPESFDIFVKTAIDQRNEIFFRNALPLVEKGGAFIAVGALHLPGEKGLVKMFADAGYEAIPLKLERTTRDD